MITTNIEKAPKLSPVEGLTIHIVGNTEKMMLSYIIAKPGAFIQLHEHPHDQIGVCIKGNGELFSGEKIIQTKPGTSWTIPGGEPHYWKNTCQEECLLVECFSPPREDYLAIAK